MTKTMKITKTTKVVKKIKKAVPEKVAAKRIISKVSVASKVEKPIAVASTQPKEIKAQSELVKKYDAQSHPIICPIVKGGPAELAEFYQVEHENSYVDACRLCFETRKKLIDKFPEYLAPKQVYGM